MNKKDQSLFDMAIEACKSFDKFHHYCFCKGQPITIGGKAIDHTLFNETHDLVFKILNELKKQEKYNKEVKKALKVFNNIKLEDC